MKIRKATERWIDTFNHVPGSIFEKLAEGDEAVSWYDSDSLRLVASPRIECLGCSADYEGKHTLEELRNLDSKGKGVPCEYCSYNKGDDWTIGRPVYAFPCGWGTLFSPKENFDIDWILEHADDIAKLGFFVFDSEEFGCLLGIDAGGFDFYDAYWIPLYKLRGLKWHNFID